MIRKTIIALPLFAATLVVAGNLVGIAWERGSFGRLPRTSIHLRGGELNASYTYRIPIAPPMMYPVDNVEMSLRFTGFRFIVSVEHGIYRTIAVRIPVWQLVVAFLALPILLVGWPAARRWRRRRRGQCEACGYNLTGNVSGVCPECGQAREV